MAIRVTHGASPLLTGAGAIAGGLAGGLERRRAEQARFDLLEEQQRGAMERETRRAEEQRGILRMRAQEERDAFTREAYWDRREEDRQAWEEQYELEPQDQMEYTEAENALRQTQFFTGATEEEKQPAYERLERKIQAIRKRGRKRLTGQERAVKQTFTMEGMRGKYQFDDKGVVRPVEEPKPPKETAPVTAPTPLAYKQKVGFKAYDEEIEAHRKAMGKKAPTGLNKVGAEYTYDEAEEHWRDKHFPAPTDPHLLRFGGPAKEAAPTPEPAPKPTSIRRKMQELNIDESIQARFSDLLAGMGPAQQWEVEQAIAEYTRRIKEARNPQELEAARHAAKNFYGSVALGVTDPYGSRIGQ